MFSLDECRKSRMPSLVAKATLLPLPSLPGTVACRNFVSLSSFCFVFALGGKDTELFLFHTIINSSKKNFFLLEVRFPTKQDTKKVRFPFSKVLIHNWCNILWNNSVLEKSNEWKAEIIPNYSPYIAIWLHWSYCIVRYSCYCILYLYASLNPLAKSTLTAFRVLFVSTGHLYIIYFFFSSCLQCFPNRKARK